MRVIKLSPDDDEMYSRSEVEAFFHDRIHVPARRGRFGLNPRKATMTGLNAGTLLVFAYRTECLFLARADSGIVRDRRDRAYPAYFRLRLETITPVKGRLQELESALRQSGLSDKALVRTRDWPDLPDELEPFLLDFFHVRDGAIAETLQNPPITVDDIIRFVRRTGPRRKSKTYPTIGKQTHFQVKTAGSGLTIWTARGRPRPVGRRILARYLAVFNQTGSLNTNHYQDGFRDASYVLALIDAYLGSQAEKDPSPQLSAKGQALLDLLVAEIRSGEVQEGRPETFPTYTETLIALGRPSWPRPGSLLRHAGLDDLDEWTKATGVPAITGLIVTKANRRPSKGFPRSHGRNPDSDWEGWWEKEMSKVIRYDWSPFCERVEAPAVDLPKEPPRKMTEVARIVRDSALIRGLKDLYGGVCQLCGNVLELPSGKAYLEGHHIRPLGGNHHGPDDRSNVICVCPNCHALLDYAAVEIDLAALEISLHVIGEEYVDYHNRLVAVRLQPSGKSQR